MITAEPINETACLDRHAAAKLCLVSLPHWDRLTANAKNPEPIRLGKSVRWLRDELLRWLAAGAPDRETWNAMKGEGNE